MRSDFGSTTHLKDSGAASACAYPSHPGMDEELQLRFQFLAYSNESVLIVGENGVGKEILVYAMFDAGRQTPRSAGTGQRKADGDRVFLFAE